MDYSKRLDASTVLHVSLKSKGRLKDDLVGQTEISVERLSQESTDHEGEPERQTEVTVGA